MAMAMPPAETRRCHHWRNRQPVRQAQTFHRVSGQCLAESPGERAEKRRQTRWDAPPRPRYRWQWPQSAHDKSNPTSRTRGQAHRLPASGMDDGNILLWEWQTGQCLLALRSDRPYERMNISGVTGITEAQEDSLKALGAIEIEDGSSRR